jgi:hypothetical protein
MIPLNGMCVVVFRVALSLAQCIDLLDAAACDFPHAACKGRFCLKRQKLDELTAKDKAVLCRTYLKTGNNGELGMTAPLAETSKSGTGPWHFIRRILYGHSI